MNKEFDDEKDVNETIDDIEDNDEDIGDIEKVIEDGEDYNVPEEIYIENVDGREDEDDEVRLESSKKKKSFKGSTTSYVVLALAASMIGGVSSTYIAPKFYGGLLPYPSGYETTYNGNDNISINTSDDLNAVNAVAKKAMNSVVGITTLETKQFFLEQKDVQGVGSGVIVDSNGYILTNSHVVADGNAKEIKVLFENGESLLGQVLWNDKMLDLAVVKVDAKGLPAAELGDSDLLEIGDLAVAIGNPLGLEFERSVTSGIISGLNRSVRIDEYTIIDDLIQTDASINPGNSGGPLLNKNGEVIGINTAKIGSAEGLGFSIPINKVKPIVEDVISTGTFENVVLNIAAMNILEFQARAGVDLGLEVGVYVLNTEEGGAAYQAGLQTGDIIIKLGDKSIDTLTDLKKDLYNYRVGDETTITVIRGQEEVVLDLKF